MSLVGTGCHRFSCMDHMYMYVNVGASTVGPCSENALFPHQDSFQRPQDDSRIPMGVFLLMVQNPCWINTRIIWTLLKTPVNSTAACWGESRWDSETFMKMVHCLLCSLSIKCCSVKHYPVVAIKQRQQEPGRWYGLIGIVLCLVFVNIWIFLTYCNISCLCHSVSSTWWLRVCSCCLLWLLARLVAAESWYWRLCGKDEWCRVGACVSIPHYSHILGR